MKFLFDENIGWRVVEFFKMQDYDIKSALDELRGESDKKILKIAYQEKRIIVTLDKDFCSFIFKDFIHCHGVILLRLSNESQENIINALKNVLENTGDELHGSFLVVNDDNVRIRKI
ncbi:DUF5615 family PIN-like protein [Patescibacteria group bacterium]|nr:hypothetical protein [Candidatus Falkowbacteria bacterium]MBU3905685.1 DUF5615 family PIN-like protein [Patescibacteria group bacterium]MCG2698360.1 DUF5615 family PIN-like protein [Candidatus Parcubacteria bacterium]MBU4015005.1 DUF5615 family PIN-like protein [Patescibacteria group bacterium]MBU4026459.1 DUF5615 family PIN-like protein [Patescibacteria group bacterium]